MALTMKFHQKIISIVVFLIVACILLTYTVYQTNRKRKTYFEIDVYDDGDYDEAAKDDFLRKNMRIDYPIVDVKIKKERKEQLPPAKKILIKRNELIRILPSMTLAEIEENFFRYLETKDVICEDDKRLGFQHDGGYNVCFNPPFGLRKPCLIYSFGIDNQWEFDDAVSKIYGCNVHSFDPSMNIPEGNRSKLIQFRKIGIGSKNEVTRNGWRMKTFEKILKMNGHSLKVIDYLKFDIEYDEWRVLQQLIHAGTLFNVKQVGFEIHTNEFFRGTKGAETFAKSTKLDYIQMYNMLQALERLNFKQFNYRMNPFGVFKSNITHKERSCCYELHYINMNFVKKTSYLKYEQ